MLVGDAAAMIARVISARTTTAGTATTATATAGAATTRATAVGVSKSGTALIGTLAETAGTVRGQTVVRTMVVVTTRIHAGRWTESSTGEMRKVSLRHSHAAPRAAAINDHLPARR